MGLLATTQFTIIDYNDALSLSGFIVSTHPKTQVYNKDAGGTYIPSYVAISNVLTASIYRQNAGAAGVDLLAVGGGNGAGITVAKWTVKLGTDAAVDIAAGGTNASFGSVAATAPFAFTLNKNCMTEAKPNLELTFSCVYTDPSTSLALDFKTSASLGLMKSGGKAVFLNLYENAGMYVIRNGTVAGGGLLLKFAVYRNGSKDTSVTGSAQWKYRDPGGSWTNVGSTVALTAQDPETAATLTINAAAVLAITNSRAYRIELTDNDTEADPVGTVYAAEVTIIDFTDLYSAEMASTGGDVFKNGVGTSTVSCRLFQQGSEVDLVTPFSFLYRFSLRDKDGNASYFKGTYDLSTTITAGYALGVSTIAVTSAGTGTKAIKAGDQLVLEPGLAGEEIVTVADAYVSGVSIALKAATTKAHLINAVIKSANYKVGLTDAAKTIAITGTDIDVKGTIECEVIQ